ERAARVASLLSCFGECNVAHRPEAHRATRAIALPHEQPVFLPVGCHHEPEVATIGIAARLAGLADFQIGEAMNAAGHDVHLGCQSAREKRKGSQSKPRAPAVRAGGGARPGPLAISRGRAKGSGSSPWKLAAGWRESPH